MGKRELGVSLCDHIVDDDDQDVLAVTGLGRAQLAGLNNSLALGHRISISRDQIALHKVSLQACVLRGILGLDQSNLDLLVLVCRLGRSAGSHHAQSLLDLVVGVSTLEDVLLDDLAIKEDNSIIQSDLVSTGVGQN